jgi:hypothetical protein
MGLVGARLGPRALSGDFRLILCFPKASLTGLGLNLSRAHA